MEMPGVCITGVGHSSHQTSVPRVGHSALTPHLSTGRALPSLCRRTQTVMGRSVAPLWAGLVVARILLHCWPLAHMPVVTGAEAVLHRAQTAPGHLHRAGGAEPLTDPEQAGDGGDLGGAELYPEKHPAPHVSLICSHQAAGGGVGWGSVTIILGSPQPLGAGLCTLPPPPLPSIAMALNWLQFSEKLHLKSYRSGSGERVCPNGQEN